MDISLQKSSMKDNKNSLLIQYCLRSVVVVTTLIATIVMVTTKETTDVMGVVAHADYTQMEAFKFFAVANSLACAVTILSLIFLAITNRRGMNIRSYFYLFIVDVLMLCLIVASFASATTTGYVGKYGNENAGWAAICDYTVKFCNGMMTAMGISCIALISLLALTFLSAILSRVHNNN